MKLEEINNALWPRIFLMSVKGHEKEHILTEPKPKEKAEKYVTWIKDNDMICAWIMNSVVPRIGNEIMYCKMAKEMSDSLEDSYSHEKNSRCIF